MSPIRRHWQSAAEALLTTFPAVVLTGARQVGKTTVARAIGERLGGAYLSLDDISVRSQALRDPQGLVSGRKGLLIIDEVQLAPELMRAIKLVVDHEKKPGQFLLTGSANLLAMRSVGETLAGRSAWLELPPLLWSELAGQAPPRVLEQAFDASSAEAFVQRLAPASAAHAETARRLAIEGTMPGTLGFDAAQRRAWYQGYRQTFLERDLRQLANIENLPEFGRLLQHAAYRTATLLNKSALAADAGLSQPTLRRYLDLLEVAYQFFELPPFFSNLGKRLTKTPKLYAHDVGLAAWLSAIESWSEAQTHARDGALLETWAVAELRSLNRLASRPATMCFFRTSDGKEVDVVLERGQQVVAIELKASATTGEADLKGLRELRGLLGERFRLGIVAHLGTRATALDASLCSVPLASLLGATAAR